MRGARPPWAATGCEDSGKPLCLSELRLLICKGDTPEGHLTGQSRGLRETISWHVVSACIATATTVFMSTPVIIFVVTTVSPSPPPPRLYFTRLSRFCPPARGL